MHVWFCCEGKDGGGLNAAVCLQMALALLTHVTTASPASLAKVSCSVLPRVLELVRSPLLQGGVLAAIQDFLQALLLSRCPHLDYR